MPCLTLCLTSCPTSCLNAVFERHYRELLDFLARRLPDRETAADLTQESFARVYAAQRAGTTKAAMPTSR